MEVVYPLYGWNLHFAAKELTLISRPLGDCNGSGWSLTHPLLKGSSGWWNKFWLSQWHPSPEMWMNAKQVWWYPLVLSPLPQHSLINDVQFNYIILPSKYFIKSVEGFIEFAKRVSIARICPWLWSHHKIARVDFNQLIAVSTTQWASRDLAELTLPICACRTNIFLTSWSSQKVGMWGLKYISAWYSECLF